MTTKAITLIVGGTSGLGLVLAKRMAGDGENVVIAGRDAARAKAVASEFGAAGIALDLNKPEGIADALADVGPVRRLVLTAILRDANSVRDFNVANALELVTLKLVGYTEVVHALADRLTDDASIVIFGGQAMSRPYPGSTTVTTVNGGVAAMVRTMAVELAPIRVNAIHPGVIGDSPAWEDKPAAVLDAMRSRTPIGRLVTMEEIADATIFLLENGGVNGVNLSVDGGTLLT
jgi:NAD(P)-dependent dehydrogenase (short-subunit alcohol dehydrogenase family)